MKGAGSGNGILPLEPLSPGPSSDPRDVSRDSPASQAEQQSVAMLSPRPSSALGSTPL